MANQRVNIEYVHYYTDGSAARKLAPARTKQQRKPFVQKQQRIRICIDPIATLGIVVAVVMLVLMAVGVFQLRAAQREAVAMEQYVAQLQAKNEELKAEYDSGYDLEAVERLALALGMVPKEAVPHITITIPEDPEVVEPTFWEQLGAFFTELFA